MSSQSSYPRNSSHPRPYYSPHPSMNSTESGHLYRPAREMGPPFPPQPIEIDVHSSRTLPSPSASASNAWDSTMFPSHGIGEVSSYVSSNNPRQPQLETQVRGMNQDPIANWYTDNDGPWIPKGISVVVPDERQPRQRAGNRMPMQYGTYRQPIPSDAGSFPYAAPPSDSGYGSHGARRSDGNASVFSADVNDRDTDLQSLAGHVADYQPYQGMGEALQSRDIRANDQWAPTTVPSSAISDLQPAYVCPTCHKAVKTRSELKKHDLRHRKPFMCNYPGCTRTEGFSTTNDLDRHTKSKHPSAVQGMESTKRYRCLIQGCKSKEKSWPRLDNFRSHLKRVHHLKPEEEDDTIRRAEFWEPAVNNSDQDMIDSPLARFSLPDPSENMELSRTMESTMHNAQPRAHITEPDWKQVSPAYPDTMEPYQDTVAPKVPHLEEPEKLATPEQSDPSSDERPRETVQPVEVFLRQPQVPDSRSTLGNILAPVSRNDSASNEIRATPQSAIQTSKVNLLGKATRHDVSASDAKLTEVIKSALVSAHLTRDIDDRSLYHSPKSDLPTGQSPSGRSWSSVTTPAMSSMTSEAHTNSADSPSMQEDSRDLEAQKNAIEVLKTLHELGYIIHKDPSHSPKPQNPGSAASSKSENLVTCENCGKFKGRPCELKKHMKRHSRPYGCTFLTCSKTFGSKNDWKRHENSQHFHLETWRCDEEKPEGGACAKVYYRGQTFKDHLKKDHSISEFDAVKSRVERCRLGRNCQARFWCGFCVKLIDLTKKGIEAWAERFDHIDDHFMGRHGLAKQSIQDWIPVDSGKPKGEMASPHALNPSPGKEGVDESSSSGSSNGNRSDGPGPAGASSAHAMNLDSHVESSNKRKHSGSSNDISPPKKARVPEPYRGETIITCCQCGAGHNPRLHQSCIMCEDENPHKFCSNCTSARDNVE